MYSYQTMQKRERERERVSEFVHTTLHVYSKQLKKKNEEKFIQFTIVSFYSCKKYNVDFDYL